MRAGRSVPSFVASFALLLSSLIAACGGSGDGGVAPPAAVATVSVSLAASSLVAGQATQATAALKDAGGTTLSGRAVTWSTSNTGTATVDANGLVSAVAAGVVNIIATSEGRSGQASLTVSEPLQVTGLTLLTPGGLALDLGNVAGIIQVSADVQVPAGFKGTREVTIGGVSFAKDSLHAGTALTAVAGTPNVMVAALTSTIPVNTSQVVTTITAQELDCAPVSPNGVRNLVLTVAGVVPGGTPVSASQQASLTLNNAPSVRLFGKPARTLTLVDGRRVWAGDVSLWAQTCDYDAIPTELIDRIEVLTGTAAGSVYGSDAIAGVVNVITRQGAEVNQQFTLSASQLNLESAEPGHRFYLNSFRYKGVTYNPRQQLQWESATPYVTSLDGSGFATPSNLAPNYQLPVNLRYQAPGPVPPVLSAGNWEEISAATVRFDNVGPAMSTSGGFTAPTANVNVGQSVFLPSGIRGLRLNYLGPGIAGLPDFVTPSAFADGLTGLSPSANWKFFASSDLGTIFDANKQITSASQIGASTTRSTYLGLEIPDEIGNVGRFIATTNPGNPYTTGEQLASAPYDSPAVFGRLTDGGVTALVNPPGFRAFNQSNINSVSPGISVSGSRYGSNSVAACAGFWTGTQFRYFRGSPSGGNPCSAPEIVGGTAGAGNTSISYTFTPSGWVNRAVSLYGGTGEGLYQGYLRTYDLGGNIAAGGYSSSPFSFFYDITKPTSSLSAATIPPVAGQTVSITTRSQDNLGVERYWVGVRLDLPNALFAGGSVYFPMFEMPLGSSTGNALAKDISDTQLGVLPIAGRFWSTMSGQVSSTAYRVSHIVSGALDWSRNESDQASLGIMNTAAVPDLPLDLSLAFNTGAGSVCSTQTCAGGVFNILDLTFDAETGDQLDPFDKAKFLLLHSSNQSLYYLGDDEDPVITTVGGGKRRFRYQLSSNIASLCLPAGAYLAKVIAPYRDFLQVFLPDAFIPITVVQGTGQNPACSSPRRPMTIPIF